jgi:hypothetical protein
MTNLHFHRQKILYIAIGFVVLLLFLWLNSLDPEVHRYESDNPKIQNVQSYKENIDIDIGKLIKLKKVLCVTYNRSYKIYLNIFIF